MILPRPALVGMMPWLALSLAACTAGTITGNGEERDDAGAAGGAIAGTAGASAGRGGSSGHAGSGSAGASGAAGQPAGGAGSAGGADGGGGSVASAGAGGSLPTDAGVRNDAAPVTAGAPGNPEDPPAGYVPAVIGVGYGGIRVVSMDDGATWTKRAQLGVNGGDDQNLLRCAAWGRGLWITGGWQYFTSPDGKTWTKRPNPSNCGLMQGCAYGNGRFVATCGDGTWISSDGMTWTKGVGSIGTGGHTNLRFGAGKFAAWGDNKTSYTSTDGVSWTRLGLPDVNFCDGAFKTDADCGQAFRAPTLWLRSEWQAKITRSTNGSTFKQVYLDDGQNSVAWFAWGWAPPS